MKKTFTILLLIIYINGFTQCVEPYRYFTTGLHYLTNQRAKGLQLEIGSTGAESNISYYATITGFNESTNERERIYPQMVFGAKLAYRIYKAESVLSIYATTLNGVDIIDGFYNSNSIKIMTVLGRRVALSVEPSYLIIQKSFLLQAGVNIILD